MDNTTLREACYKTARHALFQFPYPQDISDIIDTDQIDNLTQSFYEIATMQLDKTKSLNCDPDLVTRAVLYLAAVHAIPPMKEDARWFGDMLEVLIELACPNVIPNKDDIQFLSDIERGITITRQNIRP